MVKVYICTTRWCTNFIKDMLWVIKGQIGPDAVRVSPYATAISS